MGPMASRLGPQPWPPLTMFVLPAHAEPVFPPVHLASPEGLLAIGGDLSTERLLAAYSAGIFPWYNTGQPILWWSPDPRAVLFPSQLRISRSLKKTLRKARFTLSLDTAFSQVIEGCASAPRPQRAAGTWITAEMKEAYFRLHTLGYAHSVEAWFEGRLAGGLYGVALGRTFFGESMFTLVSDASKVAFAHLVLQLRAWDYQMIDCQMRSAHLASLGGTEIPRGEFLTILAAGLAYPTQRGPWRVDETVTHHEH